MNKILYWIANHNFGLGKLEFIRRLQCDIFGHHWYTWTVNPSWNKLQGNCWCAWCGRYTDRYPKMRRKVIVNAQDAPGSTKDD